MTDKIVIHMRLAGDAKVAVERVRETCSLTSNNDAVRYLIARGLESMAPQLNSKAFLDRIEAKFSKEELIRLVREMEGKG